MRTLEIIQSEAAGAKITPLPLTSFHRDETILDPVPFREQAAGRAPMPQQNLAPCRGMRTIRLSDGAHRDLFRAPSDTLNFIISGSIALTTTNGETTEVGPGDVVLVRSGASQAITTETGQACRLVQLAIEPSFPGPAAIIQEPGTILPRLGAEPHLRRMDRDEEGLSWFSSFDNFFPEEVNEWSVTTPVAGYRFVRFLDQAVFDWHPEVVNNLVIVLSGELEIEVCGGAIDDGPSPIGHFRAGDVLLAADRTGRGHIDRMHGMLHLALIVIDNEHLWPVKE